jgi:hypothetical protein
LIDDLEVSPDFLDYFQALYPLLKYDKTIWCISAWNDNGIDQKIDRQAGERRKRKNDIYICVCMFFSLKIFFIVVIFFPVLVGC